jgi:hypothetical protein
MMKKASNKHQVSADGAKASDAMRPHYDFDYAKPRPNRFAGRFTEGMIAVVVDPDVATVFRSAEAVNPFLRSASLAMPRPSKNKPSS